MILLLSIGKIDAQKDKFIKQGDLDKIHKSLEMKHGSRAKFRYERGVSQAANFWTKEDGSIEDFEKFCLENFVSNDNELALLFSRLELNFEKLYGNLNTISVQFKKPLHLSGYYSTVVDNEFGGYNPFAHLNDDFFNNKIAFKIILNFPFYSLDEKKIAGENWTDRDWGYARLGDVFSSRVPSLLLMKKSEILSEADNYIANYNIYLGNVFDNSGKHLFPKDLALITHWGLRDELKSHYADKKHGLEKQKLIYNVMKRIITQTIPQAVINNPNLTWNPYTNKVFDKAIEIDAEREADTRYEYLLDVFKIMKSIDEYYPNFPTHINRKFDMEMEMSQQEVETMFKELLSSKQVHSVAKLIEKRLGRKLQAFDIWYDGFKPRGTMSQEELDEKVLALFPNNATFTVYLPKMLEKLGFSKEKADFICSKVVVEASRGAGHAWGARSKDDKAHLRSRIGENGMDYKGYNIAVHEFGHNVEQTISLHFVDNYFINGVPNTAFTEALAFVFQKRDLELIGIENSDALQQHYLALDIFWSCVEIMGVSLVDIYTWQWMYENPNATAVQLNYQVNKIAIEVWNEYFAPIFGVKNEPILAVYSHMIIDPLYLSAYPIGHLIEFQLEKYLQNKIIGDEVLRIFALGRKHPQLWMQQAVGEDLSVKPILNSVDEALKYIK